MHMSTTSKQDGTQNCQHKDNVHLDDICSSVSVLQDTKLCAFPFVLKLVKSLQPAKLHTEKFRLQ